MNHKNLLSLGAALVLLNAAPVAAKTVKSDVGLKQIVPGLTPTKVAAIVRANTAQLVKNNRFGALKTGKTTGMDSRLIAAAFRESDGTTLTLTDSSRLKYSWGRGGDLKSTLKFDTMYNYSNGGTSAPLTLSDRSLGLYDASHNQLSVTNQAYISSTMTYDNSERTLYTYNTSNLIVTQESQQWSGASWDPSDLDKFTYNSAGKQITDTTLTWSGSAWDYSTLLTTTYTASGKENKQTVYFYISGLWLEFAAITYTYDVSDNVSMMLLQLNMSGLGLEDYQRMLYTYDVAKNPILQEIEEWDGASWINLSATASTFDASANVLSEIELNWDDAGGKYDSATRVNYTYNANNQVTSETSYTYVGTSWIMNAGDTRNNYYYQDYSPTSVKESSIATAKLNIYPIPAHNQLTIRITQESNESLNLRVTDVLGRSVMSRSYAAAKQIADEINTAELPAGQYFLQLSNGTTSAFTVVH